MKTGPHFTQTRPWNTFALLLSLTASGLALDGCKSNEAPPPLPAAKPVPTPSVANIAPEVEEDAGTKPEEKKPTGKGGGSGGGGVLGACCKALRQNAASAPPETAGHLLNAATLCDAANKQGLGKAAGFLAGLGNVPAACK